MEDLGYLNQKHLDENWYLQQEPTTSTPETGSNAVSCNICRRNFRSKQALWGHKRCCKAARAGNRNFVSRNSGTGVSGFGNDALESGWSATAKRGRKPMLEITGPECVAAGILVYMSSGKNGDVGSTRDDMMAINSSHDDKEVKQSKGLATGVHRCEVCGVCYPSGQALGGHKRKHWTGLSFVPGNRSYDKASEFAPSVVPVPCRLHWESLWTDN